METNVVLVAMEKMAMQCRPFLMPLKVGELFKFVVFTCCQGTVYTVGWHVMGLSGAR